MGRLKQMTFYCRTRRCLRQYILNYFGQSAPDYCGACYNCLHNFQEIDVGEDARAILRCVAETGQRFGAGLIAAVLCGGENEKIRRYRLERERTYGALAALSQREVQDRIRFLVDEHILELTDGQYPVLRCGERAEDVAYSDGPLMMKAVREERPAADRRRAEDSPLTERQQALFQRLREERAHLARLRGVPAFVIFSDKTLREMAAAQPRDLRQLQNVGGVGSFKAEQYGAQFLEIISDFQETAAISEPAPDRWCPGQALIYIFYFGAWGPQRVWCPPHPPQVPQSPLQWPPDLWDCHRERTARATTPARIRETMMVGSSWDISDPPCRSQIISCRQGCRSGDGPPRWAGSPCAPAGR